MKGAIGIIVGNFQNKALVKRMVRVGSQVDVVLGVKLELLCQLFRSVVLVLVIERTGRLSDIDIQDLVISGFPFRRQLCLSG